MDFKVCLVSSSFQPLLCFNKVFRSVCVIFLFPTVKRPPRSPKEEPEPPKEPAPGPATKLQPEPTSNIREIIKQFNSRPQPEPKPFEPVRSVSVVFCVLPNLKWHSDHTIPNLDLFKSTLKRIPIIFHC